MEPTKKTKKETRERTIELLKTLAIYATHLKNEDPEMLYLAWRNIVEDLTDDQVELGINYIKNNQLFCVNPQRFRFVAHGLIDTKMAFEQAKDKIYNHPAVYDAAMRVGLNFHSGCVSPNIYQEFSRVYAYSCDKVINGHELPKIPNAQDDAEKAAPKKTFQRDLKVAHSYLDEIRGILGSKKRPESESGATG